MADPEDAVAAAADALAAAVGELDDANDASGNGLKKRALELLTEAAESAEGNGDDLELEATTLDDVMVSPVLKKPRVDGGEDDDEPLTGGETGEEEGGANDDIDVDLEGIADEDDDALAPPDASTDEDEAPRSTNGHGKQLDVVTLEDEDEDEDDNEEDEEDDDEENESKEEEDDDEEEDEEDGQLLSPLQRRKIEQNKAEARQLLHQLDSSARSKLVLTALEKYGEDLFEGHEAARDAILVDACANDVILGLMKEAIRVSELYMRGTEDAPLEVDDDEDYGEEDEEDEDDDVDSKRAVADEDEEDEDEDGEINLLSDEDTDENTAAAQPADEEGEDDEEDDEQDDDDDDTAGTGGELTVESATGDEDSFDELSS